MIGRLKLKGLIGGRPSRDELEAEASRELGLNPEGAADRAPDADGAFGEPGPVDGEGEPPAFDEPATVIGLEEPVEPEDLEEPAEPGEGAGEPVAAGRPGVGLSAGHYWTMAERYRNK